MSAIPTLIVGGTGYVAGELVRLVAGHPGLALAGVSSESQAGTPVAEAFPHLAPAVGDLRFVTQAALAELMAAPKVAIFSAAPHVVSAAVVAGLLKAVDARGVAASVVDVSSDFRFRTAAEFEAVYKQPHGAPELLDRFTCAVPEHVAGVPGPLVGHPGCFATSMLIGAVPLLKLGLVTPSLYAVGTTGSTGAGRTPLATTHHPERHSNLFSYNPLGHRHGPEVVAICGHVAGIRPELAFIPQSGPFSRGIHMTIQAKLARPVTADGVRESLARFYASSPFVRIVPGMPKLKDVAGSNYCHVGVAVSGDTLAVMVTLDNLVKGAAGGAVQWMNRLCGLPEDQGLAAPAPGWI